MIEASPLQQNLHICEKLEFFGTHLFSGEVPEVFGKF
jgi:hypothetical protein